ncbi:acyltransferase family protein [Phyllobacterium sp. SB3]|uniref:acyltransferase family protein n=1 Tax=Phyllobacterium sp. SB3 TaxID=3156073 RepID=UPI0032AF93BE
MSRTTGGFGEIQGLRAIAVLAVLIFHTWASVLPGGFVGVDVFFVISGFVITNSLYVQVLKTGHFSLLDFYSRRVRRLIPAATTVLIVTFIACYFFLPPNRWNETLYELLASALFVENWMLIANTVDYLASKNAASPVQHYWSLSIEEQFYFFWPIAFALAIWLSTRLKWALPKILFIGILIVFACSLYASWYFTATERASAYFLTQTRVWELALGGLIAIGMYGREFRHNTKLGLSTAGMLAILYAILFYDSNTRFPGLAALVPTLGAALIISARNLEGDVFSILNATPLKKIGDRSYSLYLWHWPVIVLYKANFDGMGLPTGLALLVLIALLSETSYRVIEQRFRTPSKPRDSVPMYVAGSGIAISLTCAVIFSIWGQHQPITIPASETWEYPGPLTLLDGFATPPNVDYFPSLEQLKRDVPASYREKCHQDKEEEEATECNSGTPSSNKLIVLVGDSVAAQWAPALEKIAFQEDFKLVSVTKSACPYARVQVELEGEHYPSCMRWRDDMISEIAQMRPSMIFASQASNYFDVSDEEMENGFKSVWQDFLATGAKLYVIESTPLLPFDPADCLARNAGPCIYTRDDVSKASVLFKAAQTMPAVDYIDMTDGICLTNTCSVVVGNVIAWRDPVHLSATYAGLLSSYLKAEAGL